MGSPLDDNSIGIKKKSSEDEEELVDDIPDDVLLDDDLDSDPLLTEAEAIFGVLDPIPKKKKDQSSEKLGEKSQFEKKIVKQSPSPIISSVSSKTNESSASSKFNGKTVITAAILREFTRFLKEKGKIYEEINFNTILRKIPAEWHFNEDILVDILEKIIEQDVITEFKLKLTADGLKYYPSQ